MACHRVNFTSIFTVHLRRKAIYLYTTPPDTTHVTHYSRARYLRIIIYRDRRLYASCIQSANCWKLIQGTAHFTQILNLQHCNFMTINFVYFNILIILRRETQNLDHLLALHSFVLNTFLMMAPWCRNI